MEQQKSDNLEAGAFFDDVCSDDELQQYTFSVTAENHHDQIILEEFFDAARYLSDMAKEAANDRG